MSESFFFDISQAGVFATQLVQIETPIKVAPNTSDQPSKHNTYRQQRIVVGCWGIPDIHFDFDSSFIKPQFKPAIEKFKLLRKKLKDKQTQAPAPISIFAHADPEGGDAYNKALSGRRARAMFGLLTKNARVWNSLYSDAAGGDNWQTLHAVDKMRDALIDAGNASPPRAASQVIPLYMEFLAPELKLTATDFLAGLANADGKGDYQGCSEFNPVFLLSDQEEKEFKKHPTKSNLQTRNDFNAVNRRVLVFFFKPGTRIDHAKWPCPTWKQGSKGCVSRFWSDGDNRRNLRYPNARRELGKISKDLDTGEAVKAEPEETFACRFYYGISLDSPCEPGALKLWPLRIMIPGHPPTPLVKKRFVVIAGTEEDAPIFRGETGEDGKVFIPALDDKTTLILKLDAWDALYGKLETDKNFVSPPPVQEPEDADEFPDESRFLKYTLNGGMLVKLVTGGDQAVKDRLFNLGYGPNSLARWDLNPAAKPSDTTKAIKRFQHDHQLDESGTADDATLDKLEEEYGDESRHV